MCKAASVGDGVMQYGVHDAVPASAGCDASEERGGARGEGLQALLDSTGLGAAQGGAGQAGQAGEAGQAGRRRGGRAQRQEVAWKYRLR